MGSGISPLIPILISEPLVSEVDWQQAPAFRPVNERKPEHLVYEEQRPCVALAFSGPIHLQYAEHAEYQRVCEQAVH